MKRAFIPIVSLLVCFAAIATAQQTSKRVPSEWEAEWWTYSNRIAALELRSLHPHKVRQLRARALALHARMTAWCGAEYSGIGQTINRGELYCANDGNPLPASMIPPAVPNP